MSGRLSWNESDGAGDGDAELDSGGAGLGWSLGARTDWAMGGRFTAATVAVFCEGAGAARPCSAAMTEPGCTPATPVAAEMSLRTIHAESGFNLM